MSEVQEDASNPRGLMCALEGVRPTALSSVAAWIADLVDVWRSSAGSGRGRRVTIQSSIVGWDSEEVEFDRIPWDAALSALADGRVAGVSIDAVGPRALGDHAAVVAVNLSGDFGALTFAGSSLLFGLGASATAAGSIELAERARVVADVCGARAGFLHELSFSASGGIPIVHAADAHRLAGVGGVVNPRTGSPLVPSSPVLWDARRDWCRLLLGPHWGVLVPAQFQAASAVRRVASTVPSLVLLGGDSPNEVAWVCSPGPVDRCDREWADEPILALSDWFPDGAVGAAVNLWTQSRSIWSTREGPPRDRVGPTPDTPRLTPEGHDQRFPGDFEAVGLWNVPANAEARRDALAFGPARCWAWARSGVSVVVFARDKGSAVEAVAFSARGEGVFELTSEVSGPAFSLTDVGNSTIKATGELELASSPSVNG